MMAFSGKATLMEAAQLKAEIKAQCFDGETPIHCEDGLREIWCIAAGAMVLSRCEKAGKTGYKQVINVFEHDNMPIFQLWFHTDHPYGAMPITPTAEHPFWIHGKGWTKVRDLKPRDFFETHDGVAACVDCVEDTGRHLTVYNLEVEDFHTYFVASEGLWVHNKNHELDCLDVLNSN